MQHYIFNTSIDIEQKRLNILNRLCNDNTKLILSKYIKPRSKVLECGFGEGQMSDFINSIAGIKYIGIDNDIGRVAKRYEKDKYIFGDLTKLGDIKALKRKKFDVIYMRWILAYLPQHMVIDVIYRLHSMLKSGGILILEECDLYKSYLTRNDIEIKIPIFEEWITLSRFVETAIDSCNFRMGEELDNILSDIFKRDIKSYKFQPILERNDKEIITLGLKSSSCALIEKKIVSQEQINRLISEIDYSIVNNEKVKLHYVETTTYIINK